MRSVRETVTLGVVLLALLALVHALPGCPKAQTPREEARAIVLTVAEGVRAADLACASVARGRVDVKLALDCADAYDRARLSLEVAESAVDLWDRGSAGDVPCATARAVDALTELGNLLRVSGGKVPPVLEDALRLAPVLTRSCKSIPLPPVPDGAPPPIASVPR